MLKDVCSGVYLKSWLRTTVGSSPRLSLTTSRMSLLDSSTTSEMPVMRPSFTTSAILAMIPVLSLPFLVW